MEWVVFQIEILINSRVLDKNYHQIYFEGGILHTFIGNKSGVGALNST